MKKIYIIIIGIFLGIHCFAQNDKENNFSKDNFLSQFGIYFENIEITETGTLLLQAKEQWSALAAVKKNTIIEMVLSQYGQILASVSCGYKRELWQKNTSNAVALIDSWDLNTLFVPKVTTSPKSKTMQKTDVHPWFCSFGLGGSYSTDDIANLNVSCGIGFFLLAINMTAIKQQRVFI